MVFITDGHGTAIIGESEHELSRGDILIYNAGISHYERSRMDDPMEACFIAYASWRLPICRQTGCSRPLTAVFPAGDMYGIFDQLFSSLLREFERKERFYMEIAQNMSRTLLMYLFRLINKTENAENLLIRDEF